MEILRAVSTLDLPDCWVAAGFVRNLVWDHLHHKNTRLNDVDVIYYCQSDTQGQLAINATEQLHEKLPKVNWQVKNQALMHNKNQHNQHNQYLSSIDAMTFWPEQETAVAVALDARGDISVAAPFGLRPLFKGSITVNPKADEEIFWQRIQQKSWLTSWPKLLVINSHSDN
tara:strand:- start:86997 stop:87509 length:513 start_codon:yes stop_codon:yes gene_type:complete